MSRLTRVTTFSPEELEEYAQLVPRIFCDYRDPRRGLYGMVYAFAETRDNEDSCFRKAVEMATAGEMKKLCISGVSKRNGYEGFEHSVERLKELGFDTSKVALEPLLSTGPLNTLKEAITVSEYAYKYRGDIGIIAPPFHLVRAFMTCVSALGKTPVRLYAIAGKPLAWRKSVLHSQGTLRNTRAGLLGDELERISKYRDAEFGKMFTPKEILAYLTWRDS